MSRWERVRLGDVCEKVQSLPQRSDFEIYYIDISSIDNIGKSIVCYKDMDSKDAPSRAKQILKYNDILVSTVRPNLNAVAIVTRSSDKMIIGSTGFCVLRCMSRVTPEFVFYFCQSKRFINSLVRVAKGASYPAVTDLDVKNIEIPLPPLELQKKIAQTLDTASELIDLYKKQLAELDNLIKSTFYDMFGDPVTNDKGWKVQKIGELCDVVRGGSPRPIEKYLGGIIPWIKIGDATKGNDIYLDNTKEHIIEEGIQKSRYVKSGSMIFANCGVSLGFARIVNFDGCIHDGWLALQNINDEISKIFFLKQLNEMTQYFRGIAPGGTQPNLNTNILKNTFITLPPLKLQTQFATIVTTIEAQKSLVQHALNESQTLFDSLMSQYFD